MTSKSRHKRGKQALPSKKKRRKQTTVLTTAAEESAATIITPATPLPPTAPPTAVPKVKPSTATTTASYPYVPGELKRIGIMAVIMLAVLIVLSRVIS